jgi:hypothetical protein
MVHITQYKTQPKTERTRWREFVNTIKLAISYRLMLKHTSTLVVLLTYYKNLNGYKIDVTTYYKNAFIHASILNN